MSNEKKREFVTVAGRQNDVIAKLSKAVYAEGGYDEDILRIVSNGKLCREVARMIVGAAATRTLADMIADAGFRPGRFNANITERNFPLDKEGAYDASGLRLFGGDRVWSINEVEAAIKPEGGRLEGLVRGLAYLKANPDALKDGPIVFPASSWANPDGLVDVPFAGLDGGGPWLGLCWDDRGFRWIRQCRCLVSCKSGA